MPATRPLRAVLLPFGLTTCGNFRSHVAPTTGSKQEVSARVGGACAPPISAAVWSRAFRLLLSESHSCGARLLFTET